MTEESLADVNGAGSPKFSDDQQWWWTGLEWVPASQAPPPPMTAERTADADFFGANSSEGPSRAASAVHNLSSGGQKALGWIATKAAEADKKIREQNEATAARRATEREIAATKAATERQAAATKAAKDNESAKDRAAQFDTWFNEVQRECPMPMDKSRAPLPGGIALMPDECSVSTAKHWGFSSDRLALTTHRLVWSHGRLTKDSKQLYLTDIREVAYHKPWMGTGTLTVEAASQHSMEGLVHMKHAEQFRDSLLSMVHFAKNRRQRVSIDSQASAQTDERVTPITAPAPDKFDQLKRLAQLKEQGILTDEEFQSEKAKLLA